MDIDSDDEAVSEDELDVIDDFESEEDEDGEEEREDDDEEYEDEDEIAIPTPKPISSSSRRPAAVVTPVPPPRPSRAAPSASTPSITPSATASGSKTGLRIRLNVNRPSPLGKGAVGAADIGSSGGKRPSREAAKKAEKRTKVVAMEAELGKLLGRSSRQNVADFPGSDQDAAGSSEQDELAQEDELEDEQDAEGEEEMDIDMDLEPDRLSDGQSFRAVSPTKLTARQRAKGNADLQGVLIALPSGMSCPYPKDR